MQISSKKAFTMMELVFVIVVIGILAAIAVPRFAATRDDALITKGIATLASVRSAIATERQKRILRGDFTPILDLGDATYAFNRFDSNGSLVLEYPMKAGTSNGKWGRSGTVYTFYHIEGECDFNLTKNRLTGECPVFGN